MPYLLLFDIDGTILKFKEGISKQIFSEILTDIFNISVNHAKLPDFSGKTDLQILKEIIAEYNLNQDIIYQDINSIWDRILKKFEKYAVIDNYNLLPGIEQLIFKLNSNQNFRLGLLTGNFKKNAYLKLSIFDFEYYFPIGSFGCDNPERDKLFDIAIERANEYWPGLFFNSFNTYIIGDSPKDIQCAKVNNSHSIAVATGYFSYKELYQLNPDLIFYNFEDYNTVINRINEYCRKLEANNEGNNNCN